MYRMLIVEDEERIRKSMVFSVDWNAYGFEVIGEAANGEEALEIIRQCAPHCVFTDVRMPVMDGLQLAKKLNSDYPDIIVLVLSGYSDFDFVQSALRSCVFDYLLKPTDITVFTDTLRRLKKHLDERQSKESHKSKIKYLEQNFNDMRRQFILALLDGNYDNSGTFLEKLKFFELDLPFEKHMVVVLFAEISEHIKEENPSHWIENSLSELLKHISYIKNNTICVTRDENEIVLIFRFNPDLKEQHYIRKAVAHAVTLLSELPYHSNVYAGIGQIGHLLLQVNLSYDTAAKALESRFYRPEQHIIEYHASHDPLPNGGDSWVTCPQTVLTDLVAMAITGNIQTCNAKMDHIFKQFSEDHLPPSFIKEYCYSIIFLIKQSIPNSHVRMSVPFPLRKVRADISNAATMNELLSYMKNYLRMVCNSVNLFREGTNKDDKLYLIESIKSFLKENYTQNISLSELSDQFHFSASYISFLFKSLTGENYVDYVKKLRMERAAEYLKQGKHKVYEIAQLVGYHNYRYFDTQFKRLFGLSPTKYRDYHTL